MTRRKKPAAMPACPYCERDTALVKGNDIYGDRCWNDAAERFFYVCWPCSAWVSCAGKTTKPLGTPANFELRRARMKLHERIDPIWMRAEHCGEYSPEDPKAIAIIRNTARSRLYTWLAWKLGVDKEDCHTAMFDLAMCRRAWTALAGVDYVQVRDWYKARNRKPETNDDERRDAI